MSYQFTSTTDIRRLADNVIFSTEDEENADFQAYLIWLGMGNMPLPAPDPVGYQLTPTGHVKRLSDEVLIPSEDGNPEYQTYRIWLADGNEPLPFPGFAHAPAGSTYKLTTSGHVQRMSDLAVIPPDPSNVDYAEYLVWVANGNTPLPADPLLVLLPPLLKTELYNRMTDEELEQADAFINSSVPTRMRRMFDDAVELYRDDENLFAALAVLFGPTRAAELLN